MSAQTDRLIRFLAEPDNHPDDARANFKGSDRAYLDALFELLDCHQKRARNRAAKLITNLAKAKPAVVYRRIDDLIALLSAKENILLWNALLALGHIAREDDAGKIARVLPKILKLLAAEAMVTAANAMESLVNIAAEQPELAGKIIGPLTRIGKTERNDDCRVVLTAKAAKLLAALVGKADARQHKLLVTFATSQAACGNDRIAKPAARLLKKLKPRPGRLHKPGL